MTPLSESDFYTFYNPHNPCGSCGYWKEYPRLKHQLQQLCQKHNFSQDDPQLLCSQLCDLVIDDPTSPAKQNLIAVLDRVCVYLSTQLFDPQNPPVIGFSEPVIGFSEVLQIARKMVCDKLVLWLQRYDRNKSYLRYWFGIKIWDELKQKVNTLKFSSRQRRCSDLRLLSTSGHDRVQEALNRATNLKQSQQYLHRLCFEGFKAVLLTHQGRKQISELTPEELTDIAEYVKDRDHQISLSHDQVNNHLQTCLQALRDLNNIRIDSLDELFERTGDILPAQNNTLPVEARICFCQIYERVHNPKDHKHFQRAFMKYGLELEVSEICPILNITQPTVSRSLIKIKNLILTQLIQKEKLIEKDHYERSKLDKALDRVLPEYYPDLLVQYYESSRTSCQTKPEIVSFIQTQIQEKLKFSPDIMGKINPYIEKQVHNLITFHS